MKIEVVEDGLRKERATAWQSFADRRWSVWSLSTVGASEVIVCGVDIKGQEASLAIVQDSAAGIDHVESATKKLALKDDRDRQSLLTLKTAVEAFAHQHKIEVFVIRSRQAKGRLASGGITFKIETLFQLSATPVVFVSPLTLAKFAKSNSAGLPTSILGYQEDAYRAGAYHISNR